MIESTELSTSASQKALREKGYLIRRGCLSAEQIKTLRAVLEPTLASDGFCKYGGKYLMRGMNRSATVARILSSPQIISILRDCVSPQSVMLTGECDLMANTTSNWHKDITPGMGLGDAIFDDPKFEVYKLAIYLQDHAPNSTGVLKVRPGSHRCRDGRQIRAVDVPVRAGDVVVFDVRLDHVGQLPRLRERMMRRLARLVVRPLGADAEVVFTVLRGQLQRNRPSRLAVYATFGGDTPALHAYERAGRRQHGGLPAPLDPEAARAFRADGIGLIQAT